jgi:Fe-S-cluster containining protein
LPARATAFTAKFAKESREVCEEIQTEPLTLRGNTGREVPRHSMLFDVRSRFPSSGDQELIQIVDSALADVARRSGEWLVCRPGCTQCCIGVFSINQLDAARLRRGLTDLELRTPERAVAVRSRARDALARLGPSFPGDPVTGVLDEGADAEERFAGFANDEPCPALDPATGNCELYESRPMTCRVFGPPVQSEDGLGVCELCFQGAYEAEIAACEMKPDPDNLEEALLKKLETNGARGNTIIAYCLAS